MEFSLHDDGHGGTNLSLLATDVDASIRMAMVAGWISVLMAMKAAVDYEADLRNHDASRSWGVGYADTDGVRRRERRSHSQRHLR